MGKRGREATQGGEVALSRRAAAPAAGRRGDAAKYMVYIYSHLMEGVKFSTKGAGAEDTKFSTAVCNF
eukprot:SAG31_NODE_5194_length_2686_cov_6.257055_2_plen_68_part_00